MSNTGLKPLKSLTLYCGISNHGFGHLAQTAPILKVLMDAHPHLRLIIQSEMSEDRLRTWIERPFRYVRHFTDPGIPMHHAAAVDREATVRVYRQLMGDWNRVITEQVSLLKHDAPDLILSNNSFTLSEAAARCQLPSVHVCSLNWADIYRYCAAGESDTQAIYDRLVRAYNQAEMFIQLTPAMPMPDLSPKVSVDPIGRRGECHPLAERLGRSAQTRFALISMGGMDFPLAYETWPVNPDWVMLIGTDAPAGRTDIVDFRKLGISHTDLIRSCDVLVGKPGYGTFVEVACNLTPMLYLSRQDWPEQPYLVDWLAKRLPLLEVSEAKLREGDLGAALVTVTRRQPERPWQRQLPPLPKGEQDVASLLTQWLG